VLAVILESGEPSRIYTALSLLVSTAVEGEPARGLLSFGALPAFLLSEQFDGALADLWATAAEVDDLRFWACAAAVAETGDAGSFAVMSTPRFLKETAGARLVVV
jgi:hypothetical protein